MKMLSYNNFCRPINQRPNQLAPVAAKRLQRTTGQQVIECYAFSLKNTIFMSKFALLIKI